MEQTQLDSMNKCIAKSFESKRKIEKKGKKLTKISKTKRDELESKFDNLITNKKVVDD